MGCQHGERAALWLCSCCCLQELDSWGTFASDEGIFSICWWEHMSCYAESKCPIPTSSVSLLSKNTLKLGAISGWNYFTETGMVCSGPYEYACGQSGVALMAFRDEHVASPIEICSRRLWMSLPRKTLKAVVTVNKNDKRWWRWRFSRCQ